MRVKRGEYVAQLECKSGVNERSPRKLADQRHSPARFPRTKIGSVPPPPRQESDPVRPDGSDGEAGNVGKFRHFRSPHTQLLRNPCETCLCSPVHVTLSHSPFLCSLSLRGVFRLLAARKVLEGCGEDEKEGGSRALGGAEGAGCRRV
ncbi:hypothetical protein PR048_002187 [Dryococelus australis]|uniref:Uncharacterized protein n=1 Tax=Dryococelus australis TaxID=614101 RepID=A0ABQ9IKK8_9NEOP|nr:hypothetical protein PR048_002187 [Dryococelus australis]